MLDQMRWLFFGFSGRISRGAFALAGALMILLAVFILYRLVLAENRGVSSAGWDAAFSVLALASLWAQAALGAKRMHDLDRPGLFAALLFVPALNFIVFIALCVVPGTPGPNQFGPVTNAPMPS